MFEMLLNFNGANRPIPKGKWLALTPDSVPRYDHAMAHYNGDLYVFGGRGNAATGILNTIRKYNLATNIWSSVSVTIPTARQGLTATVIGSKIYLYGGLNGATKYGDLFAFDPVANTLVTLAPGLACNGQAVAAYGGELYVYGGQPTNSTTLPVNTLRKYNPSNNTWTTLSTLGTTPTGRFYAAYGISNGKFYIAGGTSGSSVTIQGMDIYDIATNTWLPPVSTVAKGLAFGSAGVDGRLYLIGGSLGDASAATYVDTTRVYDTELKNWTTVDAYPVSAGYISTCTVDNVVYGFGGYSPTVLASLFRYIP